MNLIRKLRRVFRKDDGSSMIELALLMPTLVLLLFAAVDFARAYFLSTELTGAALAAAEYGIQNRTDTTGISAAATADAPDVPNLVVSTPTWGCECSDGTGSSTNCSSKPSCSYNLVYWVAVQTSSSYTSIYPWNGIPSTITITQSARVRSGS